MGYTPPWEKLPRVAEVRRLADKLTEARRLADELTEARRLASAYIATSRIKCYATIALRERIEYHTAVEKTHAQESAANPTSNDHLVKVAEE